MNLNKAIRLASKWSEGYVCSLRDGEAMAYHELCLEALQRMRREQETVTIAHHLEPVTLYMTNADRIRSMTDEELASFLAEVEYRRSIAGGGAIWLDDEGAMNWLKQPYKEET